MKRIIILFTLLSLTFCGLNLAAEESPMASFMGAKWGVTIKDFAETFKYKDKISMGRGAWPNYTMRRFQLGETKVTIMFMFYTQDNERMKVTPESENKLILRDVMFIIFPEQFDSLKLILTEKYGKPTDYKETEVANKLGRKFLQKEAIWMDKSINRMIHLKRFTDTIEYGEVMFKPIKIELSKTAKSGIKKGADEL
jgi:hypothetical protein